MAFNFNTFMGLISQDNPQFKRFALSSEMDPIIKQLTGKTFIAPTQRETLEDLVAFLPYDKQTRYRRSLGYLTQEGGVRVGAIPAKPVMTFVKFAILEGFYVGYDRNGTRKDNIPLLADGKSIGVRSFVHRHQLSWSASNGHPQSLATVRTREYVKFRTDTQSPPFNNIQDPDREFYAPGKIGSLGATNGIDDHSTKLPALICCSPRTAGTLIAEQWYQYSTNDGATWKNIDGAAFLIEKTVRAEGNDWVFVFKKTNWPQHNTKRFHFEVHYTIGPAPAFMPRTEADVPQGMESAAEINNYARKVVSRG